MSGEGVVLRRMAPGFCVVRVRREGACGENCMSCSVCAGAPPIDIPARNRVHARPGQRVRFESGTAHTLKLAALTYVLPIVLFLAGYLIRPIAGAVGLLAGMGVTFAVNRSLQKSGGVNVTVTEILSPQGK